MTNNIWHDSIDSNFTEIAGLVDNPKTIVKHNGKYAYLADLLVLESKLETAIQALKLAKEKIEFIKYHIESGEDITVEPHCQIGIDEINKVLNKKD